MNYIVFVFDFLFLTEVNLVASSTGNSYHMPGSKRRFNLGIDVSRWDNIENKGLLGNIHCSDPGGAAATVKAADSLLVAGALGCVGATGAVLADLELSRKQLFELLRRSKMYLGMRSPSAELIAQLDRRRSWNVETRPVNSNLDLFTSVKYSYSSALPCMKGRVDLLVSSDGRGSFAGVARSNNARLDPVDAQKIFYRRRLEIQRAIVWGYCNDFVPVMMTLTVFHDWSWQPLQKLIAVLRASYNSLFNHNVGERLKNRIGFRYRIFRMEETINLKRNGWHPHFHVILFVPRANLQILSDLEPKLRDRWARLVCKNYLKFVGEAVPESFVPALRTHGLYLSRYSDGSDRGKLYCVDDSKYLAKIMGCDAAEVYGGDKEVTAMMNKDSIVPFDLLRGKPTAENVDLWNEYAIATKGLSCFRFTPGFKRVIDDYFAEHPELVELTCAAKSKSFKLVGRLREDVYNLLYRNFKLPELRAKIAEGGVALILWLSKLFVDWKIPFESLDECVIFCEDTPPGAHRGGEKLTCPK